MQKNVSFLVSAKILSNEHLLFQMFFDKHRTWQNIQFYKKNSVLRIEPKSVDSPLEGATLQFWQEQVIITVKLSLELINVIK